MFNIKVADHVYAINNKYDDVRQACGDYITDEKPEKVISVDDREISRVYDPQKPMSEGMLEAIALHHKAAVHLMDDDVFLLYGVLMEIDGKGLLFTARQGEGKTTHARLWKLRFGNRVNIVNGDKPFLCVVGNKLIGYGSPRCGVERWQEPRAIEVKAIVVLERSSVDEITRLSQEQAEKALMESVFDYPQMSKEQEKKFEEFVKKISKMPIYRMKCTLSQHAVITVYDALRPDLTN